MDALMADARQEVAASVRAYLARKRMSVREAARRLGIGQTALHRRVTGEIPFDVGEIVALAALLDVPVDRFFADTAELATAGGLRKRWIRSRLADLHILPGAA